MRKWMFVMLVLLTFSLVSASELVECYDSANCNSGYCHFSSFVTDYITHDGSKGICLVTCYSDSLDVGCEYPSFSCKLISSAGDPAYYCVPPDSILSAPPSCVNNCNNDFCKMYSLECDPSNVGADQFCGDLGTEIDNQDFCESVGYIGNSCEEHLDCFSGYCIWQDVNDHSKGSVCTELCDNECPFGWNCQSRQGTSVSNPGKTELLCIPPSNLPCESYDELCKLPPVEDCIGQPDGFSYETKKLNVDTNLNVYVRYLCKDEQNLLCASMYNSGISAPSYEHGEIIELNDFDALCYDLNPSLDYLIPSWYECDSDGDVEGSGDGMQVAQGHLDLPGGIYLCHNDRWEVCDGANIGNSFGDYTCEKLAGKVEWTLGCETNSDCSDDKDCTLDICTADYVCRNLAKTTGGCCASTFNCNAGEYCNLVSSHCFDKKQGGESCVGDQECTSGDCWESLCTGAGDGGDDGDTDECVTNDDCNDMNSCNYDRCIGEICRYSPNFEDLCCADGIDNDDDGDIDCADSNCGKVCGDNGDTDEDGILNKNDVCSNTPKDVFVQDIGPMIGCPMGDFNGDGTVDKDDITDLNEDKDKFWIAYVQKDPVKLHQFIKALVTAIN